MLPTENLLQPVAVSELSDSESGAESELPGQGSGPGGRAVLGALAVQYHDHGAAAARGGPGRCPGQLTHWKTRPCDGLGRLYDDAVVRPGRFTAWSPNTSEPACIPGA